MPISLVLANMRRAPVRNALAVLSLCAGTLMVMLVDGVAAAFRKGLQEEILFSTVRHGDGALLPDSEFARVSRVPGVAAFTPLLSFVAYYQNTRAYTVSAVDPRAYLSIFGLRISAAVRECLLGTRSGMIAHRGIAERLDWRVGTRIPLRAPGYPPTGANVWEFEFCGAFDAPSGTGAEARGWDHILVRFDRVTAGDWMPGAGAMQFLMRTAPGFEPRRVSAAVDALVASERYALRTAPYDDVERRDRGAQAEWAMMAALVGIAAALSTALVTSFLMIQTLSGRAAELRVLRALGFTRTAVAGLILVEALLLACAGAVAGVALALLIEPWFQSLLFAAIGAFELRPVAAAAAALGVLLLGFATAALPARRATRHGSIDPKGL